MEDRPIDRSRFYRGQTKERQPFVGRAVLRHSKFISLSSASTLERYHFVRIPGSRIPKENPPGLRVPTWSPQLTALFKSSATARGPTLGPAVQHRFTSDRKVIHVPQLRDVGQGLNGITNRPHRGYTAPSWPSINIDVNMGNSASERSLA